MFFRLGDFVTPRKFDDPNYGLVGTVIQVFCKELTVSFNGIPCVYFTWQVEKYEKR